MAKAELISEAGDTFVIRYLRKDKKRSAAVVREESEKNVWESTLQAPRLVKKEGEEVLQVPEQRFLYSLW